MAKCELCSKEFSRFKGGVESCTGNNLSVCNECWVLLREMKEHMFDEDRYIVENAAERLEYACKDDRGRKIIKEFLEKINQEYEPVHRKKIEEEQKQQVSVNLMESQKEEFLSIEQKQKIISSRENQVLKNAFYEYKVEILNDSMFTGGINKVELEKVLVHYALEGWKLHSLTVNELGKNALMAMGLGVNSTVDQIIIIFERCIKPAE